LPTPTISLSPVQFSISTSDKKWPKEKSKQSAGKQKHKTGVPSNCIKKQNALPASTYGLYIVGFLGVFFFCASVGGFVWYASKQRSVAASVAD